MKEMTCRKPIRESGECIRHKVIEFYSKAKVKLFQIHKDTSNIIDYTRKIESRNKRGKIEDTSIGRRMWRTGCGQVSGD